MTKRTKIAVVGIGHVGKEHARILATLPPAELVGVCDVDSSKKERAEALSVPFFGNHRDLIGKAEAVSIATPTATHAAIAKEFLQAGIHTLVEKPFTLHLEEADELIRLAKEKNCALQVGHIERHNPGFRRIEQIAKNIRFLEIHRLGPFTGRIQDCGVVLDLMIHDIDIVLGLVKSEVQSFDAIGIPVLTPYEDIANVRIKFKNGAIADLTASRLTPERQRKIRIFQEDAYISLDYEAQSAQIFRKEFLRISQEKIDIQKAEPLREELEFFLRGIQSGGSLGKPDLAARQALAFAIEIVESIQKTTRELASKI
ncbi:MAG: Gfo/Idh/MocA family oxidoreductase [Candidatus Omnitrophica bacterium]|nr:Gfo/Idh/MocA family oxidoreductase [Candidatus Omnitrophota bacterium]